MEVIWSPSALREVERIFDYLADFNPRAAAEVFKALIKTGNDLESLPYRGRLVRSGEIREIVVSYPYIIRYRITHDVVRILRVRHTAQRPPRL